MNHAGLPPNIKDSVAKTNSDLVKARKKSYPSKHPVRISGGKYSGKCRCK